MKNEVDFLFKIVEDKTITWSKINNEYLVLENTTADIIKRINKGISVAEIAKSLSKKLSVPEEKSIDFILDLEKNIYKNKKGLENNLINDYRDIKKPKEYGYIKYYKINNLIFKVAFSNEFELSLVHPKFAHLETEKNNYHNKFEVFTNNGFLFLFVNNKFINAWGKKDLHFFQGKFSMQLIQQIHNKEEHEWLGVFHASAVSNSKKTILFLGDSGNGKSTSLALLQANGYNCLADDFVPIAAKNNHVYSFPAAISIKKNSLQTLLPLYPELEKSAEFHFKRLNKVVRYLKPNTNNYQKNLLCKDLVFIKYDAASNFNFSKISKITAFKQLVPDSWLSPEKQNAKKFLDWFENLNCYQITYSNNSAMIETVHKIFDNEL